MKGLRLDAETRVTAAIYVGQVIIFAMGAWHLGL
jgi:hypothetical protein